MSDALVVHPTRGAGLAWLDTSTDPPTWMVRHSPIAPVTVDIDPGDWSRGWTVEPWSIDWRFV